MLLVWGCSTEKNAFLNRFYHDLNAKYNGYFNANEIIKEAVVSFEATHEENYDQVLPLFIYPTQETSQALNSPMDTARKKCEIIISRHSMPEKKIGSFQKTEWCKWIDRNWLVVGKTRFYKREFTEALAVFKYMGIQYDKNPIRYEAELWKAKIHLETKNYEEARRILDDLELRLEGQEEKAKSKSKAKKTKAPKRKSPYKKTSKKKKKQKEEEEKDPEVPLKLKKDIALVYADLYLREGNHKKAIEKLEEAVKFKHKRKFRARIHFILAQLYQRSGRPEDAHKMYSEVIRLNPRYDMTFQATIYQALNYGSGDSRGVKSKLLKMLRDDKNKEYLDQIYYALADIELRENNKVKGIDYLEKSVSSSINNRHQKAKSLVRLSDLYYTEKNYIAAERYYDSTVAILPETYPGYNAIVDKSKSLTELVTNLNIIAREDSLWTFVNVSEKERIKKIEKIIRGLKEEEARRKAELEELAAGNLNPLPSNTGQPIAASGSGFWPYNSTARGIGYNDFKRVYGNRTLEDDWRRSNKGKVMQDFVEGAEEEAEKEEHTVEFYLKDLPLDPESQALSHEKIQQALYDAGFIYKNKLDDTDAAAKTYTDFYKRYPAAELTPAALYQLYLINSGIDRERYKSIVIEDFPDSEYAKILLDPNYKKQEQQQRMIWEKEYQRVYTQYAQGNYAQALTESTEKAAEPKNDYTCKYRYLKALAVAKVKGATDNPELEEALKEVVLHCSEDPIGEIAQKSLEYLRKQISVAELKSGQGKYIYNSTDNHLFILVFPNTAGSVNKAKTSFSDFNTASYTDYNLKVSSNFIDADNQLIVVKSFPDKEKAMNYFLGFKLDERNVTEYREGFTYFIISEQNYAALYVDKNVQEYVDFFQKNYKN